MKILNDFSELTGFVHEEFLKIQQAYGLQQMSAKDISCLSKSVLKSFNLANSTTKRKLKYYCKIDWAIFTAPHNWWWRFWHKKLWRKCQEEMALRELEKNVPEEEPDITPTPPQKQTVDLSALSLPSSVSPEERLLNNIE